MTKEEFQHIGKVHHSLCKDQYRPKIVEDNHNLVGTPPGGRSESKEGNLQYVGRPTLTCFSDEHRAKSETAAIPWHALAAVERLEDSKEGTGPVASLDDRGSGLVVEKGNGK